MTSKATGKIIAALTELVEGFNELQEGLENEMGKLSTDEDSGDDDTDVDVDEALVTEMRAAVEAVLENEDCSPESLASLISVFTDALEEIEPDVFETSKDDEEEDEDEEDDDDIDLDEDEEEYEEDEDEEEDE